jgi:hypothetical protein
MNAKTHRAEYLTTHAAAAGLENWMLETSSADTLTVQAITGCALEIRDDLRTQFARYADGYLLDLPAHGVAVSTVANVLAWAVAPRV